MSYDIHLHSGSGKSINIIAKYLKNKGHTVWLTSNDISVPKIQKWKPDCIMSQQWATKKASHIAYLLDIPFVMFIRGPQQYELFFPPEQSEVRCDLVVFNSYFMRDITQLAVGTQSYVLHPPIYPDQCKFLGFHNKKFMTLIGSDSNKGIDVFIKIAKKLPYLNFLLIKDYETDSLPGNIMVMSRQEDVKPIYQDTAIVLMPSERESYGRVAVEAGINGIPVISSDIPALREATYGKGVYVKDRVNENQWIDLIFEVLRDYDRYSKQISEVAPLINSHKELEELDKKIKNID